MSSDGHPELPELWMLREGPEQDVVVSTRMRLARNVDGFRFKSRQPHGEEAAGGDARLVARRVLGKVRGGARPRGAGEKEAWQRQALGRQPQPRGAKACKRGSIGSPRHTASMGGCRQKIKREIRPVSVSLDRFEPRFAS